MSDLKIDTQVFGINDDVSRKAAMAEDLGFDAVWAPEMDFDSFLAQPLIAEHTERVELGPQIATAFTRSPMVLAYMAWDLQQFSDGRFHLALGTQVEAHNERRFAVDFDWEPPGPRFREVVESIRHIWEVFQGEADGLDYDGEYYQFSLMTDFFDPGPIDHPDIPITLAAVNEYNIQLAGEIADGLSMHGFNTPKYTEEVIRPLVERGAARGDRSLDDFELRANPFVVTGETDAEMERQREEVKRQISFYGSTPAYHDVLELHGWGEVGEQLHELSKQDEWGEMVGLVTDDIVDAFSVEAPVDSIADDIRSKYGGVADRVMVDFEMNPYWSSVIDDLR